MFLQFYSKYHFKSFFLQLKCFIYPKLLSEGTTLYPSQHTSHAFFFFFLAMLWGLCNLSSLTRDWTLTISQPGNLLSVLLLLFVLLFFFSSCFLRTKPLFPFFLPFGIPHSHGCYTLIKMKSQCHFLPEVISDPLCFPLMEAITPCLLFFLSPTNHQVLEQNLKLLLLCVLPIAL